MSVRDKALKSGEHLIKFIKIILKASEEEEYIKTTYESMKETYIQGFEDGYRCKEEEIE